MNEIPALFAVTEDRNRLPPQEIAEEDAEYALIRIIERLTWTVHVIHEKGSLSPRGFPWPVHTAPRHIWLCRSRMWARMDGLPISEGLQYARSSSWNWRRSAAAPCTSRRAEGH